MKLAVHGFLSAARYLAEGVLPLLFWILLIFGFDSPDVAVLTIISALVHEAGHLIAIAVSGRSLRGMMPHISGFRIRAVGGGYYREIFTLFAGPLMNLLICAVLSPFREALEGYIGLIADINLVTALSNLMPIEGYDGYGIIERILCLRGLDSLLSALGLLSFAVSAMLCFISLYFLMRYGEGYWIFGIFFVIVVSKISKLTKNEKMKDLKSI